MNALSYYQIKLIGQNFKNFLSIAISTIFLQFFFKYIINTEYIVRYYIYYYFFSYDTNYKSINPSIQKRKEKDIAFFYQK